MKNKIISIIADIVLIMIVFCITDTLRFKIFRTDNFWLELVIYIAVYCVVFLAKQFIVKIWEHFAKTKRKF